MKIDPCLPYMTSLLALVASATTAVVSMVLGTFPMLTQSPWYLGATAIALLTLWASWHALGAPLEAEQQSPAPARAR